MQNIEYERKKNIQMTTSISITGKLTLKIYSNHYKQFINLHVPQHTF